MHFGVQDKAQKLIYKTIMHGHRHLHARKLYSVSVTTVILMLLHSETADLRKD